MVGSWTVLADDFTYEPFGPVAAMNLGNGLSVANERRNDGRLASRRLFETVGGTNLSYLIYGYDADGNIASISDEVDNANSIIYGYDAMDRLSLAVMSAGGASAESYSYTSGTNQLAAVTGVAGTRTISYDDRGNTDGETRPASITATVDYDGYGRPTDYDRTDIGSSSFLYNGLDDRVTMDLPTAGVRHFVYDADGRVMGEYGASASDVQAEFIWALPQVGGNGSPFGGDDGLGGYMPLVVATPDTGGVLQLNWVHGNHLGVPLVTTDAAGNPATTPNDYLAAGFPGQSRMFADVYYNRYRDYDPMIGRYIQADPIGLAGGSNPYAYVGGNPVNAIDPMGLKVTVIASDPREADALMEAYHRLNQSKNGRRITKPLENSSIDYQIRPITKDAFFCPPGAGGKCKDRRGNTVYVDPCNRLKLPTTNGMQPTDLEIVLGHELGHARGQRDDGPGRMNNVNVNENPVRRDLGYPARTSYTVPKIIWVP